MKQLMNVWFPHESYKGLKDLVKNPVLFALIRDGRPTLELHNPGECPNDGFNQFMFIELPFIPKPVEEEPKKEVEAVIDGPLFEETKGEEDDGREENTDS